MGKITLEEYTKENDIHLPSEPNLKHFKKQCVCCERSGQSMNKEHIFPKWLLHHTNTKKDIFNWIYGNIPADQITVPICIECNTQLGLELEKPVAKIFESIESGQGFNDHDAELLIRWMWKINGLFYWSICNKDWKYGFVTLKEHVLANIVPPRHRLAIAISLIEDPNEDFGCAPVGLDAFSFFSNIYAVGIFSKLCIAVIYSDYANYVNQNIWTVYTLSDCPFVLNPNNKFYPKIGFKTSTSAIGYMRMIFGNKSQIYALHELDALKKREEFFKHIKNSK